MTETIFEAPVPAQGPPVPDIVRGALVESRLRWQRLLGLAVDLAFETDSAGCFTFVTPESPFGWPAGALIGQPSELLVGEGRAGAILNPFRPTQEIRRHRAWLRCYNGGLALTTVSATPLQDDKGAIIGARGVCIDMTDGDGHAAQIAGRLRRSEVLRHILVRVGQEAGADAMMDSALWALLRALGAEGAAVIGSLSEGSPVELLHECGPGAAAILPTAARLVIQQDSEICQTATHEGRFILVVGCRTHFGPNAGLAIWRSGKARPWDEEDALLAESLVHLVRMILDYDAVSREMFHKATTDPLTGVLNRRAFMDEVQRHIARLDRESEAGTLMFVDLDAFKAVNDRLGHAEGDRVLLRLADLLRKLVRPGDLVGRLGGDEFALWLSHADHLTAAERADSLCKTAPAQLQEPLREAFPDLGVSVGIATRRAGSREPIETLIRRADMAMYEVKRGGRHHWRVSLLDGDDGRR